MAYLKVGEKIPTKDFKQVTILPHPKRPNSPDPKLGEGGQGAVYMVEYNGAKKALKWYSGKKFKNPDKFYENLENNIKKGKPTNAFLWPEAITEKRGEAFGYVMDLFPPEYEDFTRFLRGRVSFASMTAITRTSMHLVAAFRDLHQKGCTNHDLNEGHFLINPQNGNVLISENDNILECGKKSDIAGRVSYMAPEIVAKHANPDIETDLFSLSVLLFLLWTNNHPLEGKASCVPCMDAKHEKKIYGENPVFIFDPEDDSNRPVQGFHKEAIARWPFLPVYLQEEFIKAFSKDLLTNPAKRIIEQEWLRIFIRMRSEIFKCPCGEVYFADPVNPNPCPGCKKTNSFPIYIKTNRYNLPVHQRTKLYACHTEEDSDDFETISGEVSPKGNDFELRNISGKKWTVTDGESSVSVEHHNAFEIKKDMIINFGLASAEII